MASMGDQRLDNPEQQQILERLLESTSYPLRIVDEKSPLELGVPSAQSAVATGPGDVMAQNVFQFSGPVTINIGGPLSGVHTVAVAPAPYRRHREVPSSFERRSCGLMITTRIEKISAIKTTSWMTGRCLRQGFAMLRTAVR